MRLVKQPEGSKLCGQACVAMLCSITLEEAIEAVGSKGATTTKQLKIALEEHDVACGKRRVRGMPDKTETALLFWRNDEDGRHWMVWHKGKYYDPIAGVFRKVPNWLSNSRVTSHLKVELP